MGVAGIMRGGALGGLVTAVTVSQSISPIDPHHSRHTVTLTVMGVTGDIPRMTTVTGVMGGVRTVVTVTGVTGVMGFHRRFPRQAMLRVGIAHTGF